MMSPTPIDQGTTSEPDPGSDWSRTPAAMIASIVLGLASLWGMVWSINHTTASNQSSVLISDGAPPRAAQARMLVDLNSAGLRELQLLPGIGPKTAQRIIDNRNEHGPFKTLKDLDRVRGIGPKTIARISEWVTINPSAEKPIERSDPVP